MVWGGESVPGLVVDFEKTERGNGQGEGHSWELGGLVKNVEETAACVRNSDKRHRIN